MKTALFLVIILFPVVLSAQMQVTNTSGKTFDLNKVDIQKNQVEFITTENSSMSLSKSDILCIKSSPHELITFNNGKRKIAIKGENLNPADLATQGRIDACRFYKTKNKPVSIDSKYLEGFNMQTKKIKNSNTTRYIIAGVATAACLTFGITSLK
jgi:hypothetical protein